MKRWMQDIRDKTENMDASARWEYIRQYYWYHILLMLAVSGVVILLCYHLFWGRQTKEFQCVLVNQQTDYERDHYLEELFAQYAGMKENRVAFSSDYQMSYGDVKQEGVNESSYEKLFFNWSAGEVDAMLVPESFYRFCTDKLEGEYFLLHEMLPDASYQRIQQRDVIYWREGEPVGIYADKTLLSEHVRQEENDPVLLLFPRESKHPKAGGRFLEMVIG